MKIGITVTGPSLDDPVDPRFGRAACFLLCDEQGRQVQALENDQNLQALQGAGVQAAQQVAGAGVEWVLTGNVGPKAFRALQAAGIKVAVGVTGTAREALERFRRGEYEACDQASVEGHW